MSDDLGIDPYEKMNDYERAEVLYEQVTEYKQEHQKYRQLIAIYQSIRDYPEGMIQEAIVDQYNQLVSEFCDGCHDYSSHLYPKNRLEEFPMFFTTQLKTKLLSALEAIAEDYNFEEPSSILGRYMQANTTTIHNQNINSANSNPIQTVHQKQHTEQEVEINIKQQTSLIEKKLESKLSEAQLQQIRPTLDQYKKEPTKWTNAEKLIKGVLGFGKDIAVEIIASVIATQALK